MGTALLGYFLVGLASILLLIPGIVVLCMFYVAIPVAVVERMGASDALSRSKALTAGHKMTIFGLTLLSGLVFFVVFFLITS